MKIDTRKLKVISAISFQFMLLIILSIALFKNVGQTDTILGALVGMLVGIGTESIAQIPQSREEDSSKL